MGGGGLPPCLRDAWECCGSRELTRNSDLVWACEFWLQYRFDRLYVRGKHAAAQRFGLVGLEKIEGMQSFLSDYWGLLAKLLLDHEESAGPAVEAAVGSTLP